MWKQFKWKEELAAFLIVIPLVAFGAFSVFMYKRYIAPPVKVSHELSVPWQALEEGYRALNQEMFYESEALKELRKVEYKKVALYGYMYPIKMAEKHDHFLLSKQPHVCQFHLPAHSGSMVEVIMDSAGIPYRRHPVLLTGIFSIPNNAETGITFRLHEARYVEE